MVLHSIQLLETEAYVGDSKGLPEAASQNWADLPTWSQTAQAVNTHSWEEEEGCFLLAGRMKRKTERVLVRETPVLFQTHPSGQSLLSQRRSDAGERERGGGGVPVMETLPH